jgi:hypothetical protein
MDRVIYLNNEASTAWVQAHLEGTGTRLVALVGRRTEDVRVQISRSYVQGREVMDRPDAEAK